MTARTLGYDARTTLRYALEMLGAAALLSAASYAARHAPVAAGTPEYTALQLLPLPAVWLIPLAMLRHYRRIDELQRLQMLQSIALTGGILAGVAWSLPFLHRAFGWNSGDAGTWEVWFSVVFVVITALVTARRGR